jgi:hypothetical protein
MGYDDLTKMAVLRPGIGAESTKRVGLLRWPDPDASGRIARPEERGGRQHFNNLS